MLRRRLALLMTMIAGACDQPIQVTTAPLDGAASPKPGVCRSAQDVELYLTQPPQRPYEEVALVRVLGNMGSGDASQMASLRARTAALCADAVVQVTHGTQARSSALLCDDCDCDYDATVSRGVAVRYLREGDEPHPDDRQRAETLVAQARDADATGQLWVADELLRRALGLDPSRHAVAARLARHRLDAHDAANAIALYRLAVGAAPDNAAYRRGLADALLQQGQRHEARVHYRRAARLGDRAAAEALAKLDADRG